MTAHISLLLAAFLFTACTSSKGNIVFVPDPVQNAGLEQTDSSGSWQIIESQSGSGESVLPAWVRNYLGRGARGIETLDAYRGKYVFVGKNRGDNFNALAQWADGFTVEQDLPRLVVQRVERRFLAVSALYPDDEYGEYFAQMIKRVSDEEYPGAVKEHTFWIKQASIQTDAETEEKRVVERFEFLVAFSIDQDAFKAQIQNIMAEIKTAIAPTRDQSAAINKIRQTFFEGF